MLFKIFYLLLGLCCMSQLDMELVDLTPAESVYYSSTSSSDCSEFEVIEGEEKISLYEAVPNEPIQYMFQHFFSPQSQINFSKTCKRIHDTVMNHFGDSFVYFHGRPILKILKLFKTYQDPDVVQDHKFAAKEVLLSNSEVDSLSELIFPRYPASFLSFFNKFPILKAKETIGSTSLATKCHCMHLLFKKVDPEVVSILVILYPSEMLDGLNHGECVKLFKYFGQSQRANEILKLIFKRFKAPILDMALAKTGYRHYARKIYYMNPVQLESLFSVSYIPENYSSKAIRLLLSHCVRIKCNFRSLFKMIPPHSLSMRLDLFQALLLLDFSVVEIMGICKNKFKLYLTLVIPEGFVPLLLKAGATCPDLVQEILTGINRYSPQPIWNQNHYELAEKLGYSEGFLATMKLKMRYQIDSAFLYQ